MCMTLGTQKGKKSFYFSIQKAFQRLLLGWQLKKESRGDEVKKLFFSCRTQITVVMGKVISFDEKVSLFPSKSWVNMSAVMLTGSRKLILVLPTNPESFIKAEWKSLALFSDHSYFAYYVSIHIFTTKKNSGPNIMDSVQSNLLGVG